MATQNPIESEGTYELPEAQVDRFMLKTLVGYPSPAEEFVVVERMTSALAKTQQVIDTEMLLRFQQEADAVYVDPAVIKYAVQLTTATRDPASVGRPELARYLSYGASPRASINMVLAARALAFLRGRDYAFATWRETSCDTGSSCPTRRSPRRWAPRTCSVPSSMPSPSPPCPCAKTPLQQGLGGPGANIPPQQANPHGPGRNPDAGAAAPPSRVARRPAPRRAAAGRLPDPLPRDRGRLHGPARVRARRRPAPCRLERHCAYGRPLRPPVCRGPGADRLAPARPLRIHGFRAG